MAIPNLTKHTIEHKYSSTSVWIVDQGDAWEVWCTECGIRLGTTTAPTIEQRERDAYTLTYTHDRTFHAYERDD